MPYAPGCGRVDPRARKAKIKSELFNGEAVIRGEGTENDGQQFLLLKDGGKLMIGKLKELQYMGDYVDL